MALLNMFFAEKIQLYFESTYPGYTDNAHSLATKIIDNQKEVAKVLERFY